MDTKLTLKLDSEVINNAKMYAKENNSSVSKLVERFLYHLTKQESQQKRYPLVEELSGVIKKKKISKESERFDYLMNKYS